MGSSDRFKEHIFFNMGSLGNFGIISFQHVKYSLLILNLILKHGLALIVTYRWIFSHCYICKVSTALAAFNVKYSSHFRQLLQLKQ